MTVVIIDYGSGNLHSAVKAFEYEANQKKGGAVIKLSVRPEDVAHASHIVLPGVGAFADCFKSLKAIDGMIAALTEAVLDKGRPFLGICVGMQLMARRGLEHGGSEGLNWIDGEVGPIVPEDRHLKIPHMGWNTLNILKPHPLLEGIEGGKNGAHAYFVHSYHFKVADPADIIAETEYGGPVGAIVGRDNLAGTQFHPEKSQKLGLKLIGNFLKWTP